MAGKSTELNMLVIHTLCIVSHCLLDEIKDLEVMRSSNGNYESHLRSIESSQAA